MGGLAEMRGQSQRPDMIRRSGLGLVLSEIRYRVAHIVYENPFFKVLVSIGLC